MAKSKKAAPKKLTRGDDKMLFGVCSGVGEYFNLDATLVRLGLALVTLLTGMFPGIVVYLLAALIMPEKK